MKDEQKRFGKGFAVALAVHLVLAAGLGIFGYRFVHTPPEILEVSLESGGGGAEAQEEEIEQEEQQEELSEDYPDYEAEDAWRGRSRIPERLGVMVREHEEDSAKTVHWLWRNERKEGDDPGH